MKVTTNNVPRDLLSGYELTEKERKEFDYTDDVNEYSQRFFRYKGRVYDVDDCEVSSKNKWLREWSGYYSETFFSGVLFKFVPGTDMEQVIVGRYCT